VVNWLLLVLKTPLTSTFGHCKLASYWKCSGIHLSKFVMLLLNQVFLKYNSGHEGPISSVAFNPSPSSSLLVSVSWDKTLRMWDAVSSAASLTRETVNLTADGLCVCFRPDGQQVAVASLDGHISIFDPHQVIIKSMKNDRQYLSYEALFIHDLGNAIIDHRRT